jgi:hypothetical protein
MPSCIAADRGRKSRFERGANKRKNNISKGTRKDEI